MAIEMPPGFSSAPTNPLIQQEPNAQLAASPYEAAVQGSQEVGQAANYTYMAAQRTAFRAGIMNAETQYRDGLGAAFGRMAQQIGDSVSKAMNTTLEVDEKTRMMQIHNAEQSYLLTGLNQAQENYIKFAHQARQQAAPDGSGYTQNLLHFINGQQATLMAQAPSQASQLEMERYMGKMKIQALDQGLNFEDQRRSEYQAEQYDQMVNSQRFQAYTDPSQLGAILDQNTGYKSVLTGNGLDPNRVNNVLRRGQGAIMDAAVRGMVDKGDFASAQNLLNSEPAFQNLSDGQWKSLMGYTFSAQKQLQTQQQQQIQTQQIYNNLVNGAELKNNAKTQSVLNQVYQQQMSQFMDDKGNLLPNISPQTVATAQVNFIKQFPNAPLITQQKQSLEGMVLNGNPDQAFLGAQVIGALRSDPKTAYVVGSLSKNARTEADKILQLQQFGYSPSDVIQQVRDQRTIDPNIQKADDTAAKTYLKSNSIDSLLNSAYSNTFGFGAPSNLGIASADAKSLFMDEMKLHHDPDLAAKETITRLANKYQITDINGSKELMPYAPELSYTGNYLNEFKQSFAEQLAQISQPNTSEADPNYQKSLVNNGQGTISLANGKSVQVKLAYMPNVTDNSPASSRIYGVVDASTNLPIRYDQVNKPTGNPTVDNQPMTFSYDYTKGPTYQGAIKQQQEDVVKDHEWRQKVNQLNGMLTDMASQSAQRRGLTDPQTLGIINSLGIY